jgi:HEAT repeat protein
MQDTKSPGPIRLEAAFALVRTPRPTAPSLDALLAAVTDPLLHDYAVFGLGTFARRRREAGHGDDAGRAVARLIALLQASRSDNERNDVLHGIANSGDARAFASVEAFLAASDDSIRAAAVDAVRLMPNPEVEGIIVARMAATEAPEVRLAAVDAATLRDPTTPLVHAVETVATDASDSRSRVRAVHLLGKWLAERAEIRPILERVARSDDTQAVRQAAEASLGG